MALIQRRGTVADSVQARFDFAPFALAGSVASKRNRHPMLSTDICFVSHDDEGKVMSSASSCGTQLPLLMPELGRYEALPNQMQMVKLRDSLPGTLNHASRTKFSLVIAVHGVKPFPAFS
ncbi:hypothetical protein TgHK011_006674 [Trichoderma gracile]|nr:hypothetical protein TgHK011_006674 [Trichoderma gracile]